MLRVIVKYILNEAGYKHVVDYYVDDLKLPYEDVANVTSILRSNGIPCKDPEPFDSTRVLGHKRLPNGNWTRREEITQISGRTYLDLKSWIAKISCSHYRILKLLRVAARALERCAYLENPKSKSTDTLSDALVEKRYLLYGVVNTLGDPTGGSFYVDTMSDWRIYTGA